MAQEEAGVTPEQTIPQRLIAGRYALLGEIGRGGMGIVWLAEDRMIGRRVAIKELHLPAGVPDDEREVLEERVLREARAAGRLNDPGVVTVYDVVQETGNTYIVMELIEAPTLSAIVREQGALPQDAVARLADQLLSALDAAHAAGVVHRDVKPSNIMVMPNGRVKLTDFGIAQSTDDPRLTSSGILVGSPTYIAPERIKGADADAKSDLWALAAVLFYAVEGHSPFERSSTAATMHAIVSEVPFLTRCQGPLASVIMGLLNQVPAARPSTEQVRGLLAQATHTPPGGLTRTSPIGPGQGPGQSAGPGPYAPTAMNTAPNREHRSPMRAVLTVVLVTLVSAGLFVGGFFTHRAVQPEPDDGRPANLDPTITYGDGGTLAELSWGSYPEGACLNGRLTQGQRITASAQVECTEPHDLQFYHSQVQLRAPDDYEEFPDPSYPGVEPLTAFAEPICTLVFRSELLAGDKQAVKYRAIVPTEKGWDDNRSVNCVLYRADGGQLTESYVASE
ncbi:MAG: protein kinase [Actinophytocola sp.]|uniref:serine/threonine-protein kinase n=1 Tax=Actinophytocola sp. TaxID=1872138 RepID=UPI001320A956|nr:serine/threonine-protein kinase [Actinophytocola sp.]MPZ81465.1 protein kinase [Actinophytocola sp.]